MKFHSFRFSKAEKGSPKQNVRRDGKKAQETWDARSSHPTRNNQILCNLPVKTLFRFKSVCKLWQALISDPGFRLSSKGRKRAIFHCLLWPVRRFYSLGKEAFAQKLPNPIGGLKYETIRLLGSCNGLVLFCTWKFCWPDYRMYFWNPSTNCCKELTHLNGLITSPPLSNEIASGLYFDKLSNTYKAVVISGESRPLVFNLNESKSTGRLALLSMKRSAFRCRISGLGISAEGHLHWIACGVHDHEEFIVGFDEGKYELNKLPLPEMGDDESVSGLGELEGCLCMFRLEQFRHDCEVLVMREYGVKESWTALFNISCTDGFFFADRRMPSFIFSTDSCKDCVVIDTASDGRLAYNSKDQSFKKFRPLACKYDAHATVLTYVESLASVHLPQMN